MYIASYRGVDGRSLYQAVIHFPKFIMEGGEPAWTVAYHALIENLLDARVDFAYRIAYDKGCIYRSFLVTASARHTVEDLATNAGRLNDLVGQSVVRPAAKGEHDQIAERFPGIRRNVCQQPYFARNVEIPCDFYAYPLTSRLLRLAASSLSDFALQINCRPYDPSQEELRRARKRLVDLQLSGSVPAPLIAGVAKYVDEFSERTYLVDEYIGVASIAALQTMGRLIETTFQTDYSAQGFTGSPLGDTPSEEAIEMGLHSSYFDEAYTPRRSWRSRQPRAIGKAMGWIPEQSFASAGVANVVKASLSSGDLLAQISRRLEELERQTASHPHTDATSLLRGALKISETDLLAAAATARGILEEIVRRVLSEKLPGEARKGAVLERMIERLREAGTVPAPIYTSMHTVRTVGNIGAHRTMDLTRGDLEACMVAALRVTEWFLLERTSAIS